MSIERRPKTGKMFDLQLNKEIIPFSHAFQPKIKFRFFGAKIRKKLEKKELLLFPQTLFFGKLSLVRKSKGPLFARPPLTY